MGQAQWILLNILNALQTQNIQVNNANLNYGKFYTLGNQDHEIPASDVSNMEILAGHSGEVASCGRSHSPTGTEGSIDLYYAGAKICTVSWDCPWIGQNSVGIRNRNNAAGYLCTLGNWDHHGAIGRVNVGVYGGD